MAHAQLDDAAPPSDADGERNCDGLANDAPAHRAPPTDDLHALRESVWSMALYLCLDGPDALQLPALTALAAGSPTKLRRMIGEAAHDSGYQILDAAQMLVNALGRGRRKRSAGPPLGPDCLAIEKALDTARHLVVAMLPLEHQRFAAFLKHTDARLTNDIEARVAGISFADACVAIQTPGGVLNERQPDGTPMAPAGMVHWADLAAPGARLFGFQRLHATEPMHREALRRAVYRLLQRHRHVFADRLEAVGHEMLADALLHTGMLAPAQVRLGQLPKGLSNERAWSDAQVQALETLTPAVLLQLRALVAEDVADLHGRASAAGGAPDTPAAADPLKSKLLRHPGMVCPGMLVLADLGGQRRRRAVVLHVDGARGVAAISTSGKFLLGHHWVADRGQWRPLRTLTPVHPTALLWDLMPAAAGEAAFTVELGDEEPDGSPAQQTQL